jgi:alpha-tubulin suppressor-like RCC1 family protein
MNEIVSSWGDNSNGQLGLGIDDERHAPSAVKGLSGAKAIEAGSGHVIALMQDGTAYGWGRNGFGQTGSGPTENLNAPAKVRLEGIKAVAPGGGHTLFLLEDGTVWGCGAGFFGLFGPENMRVHPQPVKVPTPDGVVQIASGGGHGLALLEDGSVWSWGRNDRDQLGDGAEAGKRAGSLRQAHAGKEYPLRNIPAPVEGVGNATFITAGGGHNLVVTKDGSLIGWGLNDRGQLGDGSTIDRDTPVRAEITDAVSAAGAYHHTVVLKKDGTVWAIGLNECGQLGDGTTTDALTPVQVKGLSGVRQVVAMGGGTDLEPGGFGHNLALLEDGTVYAWGRNDHGELGTGDTDHRLIPVPVGLTGVKHVTVGGEVPYFREHPGGGYALAIHAAQ